MPFVLFLVGLILGAGGLYAYQATGNKLPDLGLGGGGGPVHPLANYNTVWHGDVVLAKLVLDVAPSSPSPGTTTGTSVTKSYTVTSTAMAVTSATPLPKEISDCLNDLGLNADTSKPYTETSIPTATAQVFDLIPVQASSSQPFDTVFYQKDSGKRAGCAGFVSSP